MQVRRRVCEWLAWLLRMSRPGHNLTLNSIRRRPKCSTSLTSDTSVSTSSNVIYNSSHEEKLAIEDQEMNSTLNSHSHNAKKMVESLGNYLTDENTIVDELRKITRHIEKTATKKKQEDDWQFAASVIDRLCCVVFTLFLVILTISLFVCAPNIVL